MDLLAALPASIPLVLPSTTLAEVRHRSLPLYNRLQQLISEEDRHVWVFWNEQRRETATKVEYTAAVEDEDQELDEEEEEKAKPATGAKTMESVNDRNDRGELTAVNHCDEDLQFMSRHSHPTYTAVLRDAFDVPTQTARIASPSASAADRRPRQSHQGRRYGLIRHVYSGIRRRLA